MTTRNRGVRDDSNQLGDLARAETQDFLCFWPVMRCGRKRLPQGEGRGWMGLSPVLFRSHMEENQRVARRRRFPFARERSDSTGSSSVYFTAASGGTFTDAESEGG